MGFASSLVVAYFYGASQQRDAFLLALVIPGYISSVVSGNLSLQFMPIFIDYQAKDTQRAWRVASSVVSVTAAALSLIAILGALFSQTFVAWIANTQGAQQRELAGGLMQILMPSVLFNALAALLSGLHYAERRFILPTLAPIANSTITVVVNVVLHHKWGISSLAVGYTLGSLASAAILVPGIAQRGHLHLCLNLRDEGLLRVFRTSLPLFLASLVYRFNTGFERIIGAALPTGSISLVAYATQATGILSTLTSAGIATTVFPLLSRSWADRDLDAVRRYLGIGVRSVLLVALPVVALVLVFAQDIVAILFQRGAFDSHATVAVSRCLSLLLAGYVAGNLGNVVAKCFYVTQKTTFLACYSVLETFGYVCLAVLLSRRFSFLGLAAASSVRDVVGIAVLLVMASRLFAGINGYAMLRDALKIAVSSALLLLGALPIRHFLKGHVSNIAVLAAASAMGLVVYVSLTVYVLRIEEARRLMDATAFRVPLLRRLAPRPRS